jgi:hypothetical protein
MLEGGADRGLRIEVSIVTVRMNFTAPTELCSRFQRELINVLDGRRIPYCTPRHTKSSSVLSCRACDKNERNGYVQVVCSVAEPHVVYRAAPEPCLPQVLGHLNFKQQGDPGKGNLTNDWSVEDDVDDFPGRYAKTGLAKSHCAGTVSRRWGKRGFEVRLRGK